MYSGFERMASLKYGDAPQAKERRFPTADSREALGLKVKGKRRRHPNRILSDV